MDFVEYQYGQVVSAGESVDSLLAMVINPPSKIVGDSTPRLALVMM
jgi:hypothetical protein